MRNRNYFNTPIQSNGRDMWGYGHTKIDQTKEQDFWIWLGLFGALLAVGIVGMYVS